MSGTHPSPDPPKDTVTQAAPEADLSSMAGRRDGPSLNWGFRGISLDLVQPLEAYVAPMLANGELWRALVLAIDTVIPPPPGRARPGLGFVLARIPLLGLAAVRTRFSDILVPRRRTEPEPTRDSAEAALGSDRDLLRWLSAVNRLEDGALAAHGDRPVLMRSWDVPHASLRSAVRPPVTRPVICLLRAEDGSPGLDDVDIDVSGRAVEILRETIRLLDLERASAEVVEALIRARGAEQILRDLNTEDHEGFKTRLEQQRVHQFPAADQAKALILAKGEDTPREAASLFVAAHFRRLPPSSFFELADLLVTETPTVTPANIAPRPSDKVTDVVLRTCQICFIPRKDGGLVTAFDGPEESRMGAAVLAIFESQAALLKERYLHALSLQQTLGHPSDIIAGRFAELELEAVLAARAEPDLAHDRLRRVVFGYPAVMRARAEYLTKNQRSVQSRFRRALRRAPALLARLAERGTSFRHPEVVAALCTAVPIDTDASWAQLFDDGTAELFWTIYVSHPKSVTLAGFPVFTGQGGMERGLARQRREAGLRALMRGFDPRVQDPMLEPITERLRDATALTALLSDVAEHLPDLVLEQPPEPPFAPRLFGEVALAWVQFVLRGRPWADLPPGLHALPMTRALIHRDILDDWLDPQKRIATHADPAAARASEGYRTWRIAMLVLDALVGSAFLGDLEQRILNAYLIEVVRHDPETAPLFDLRFAAGLAGELLDDFAFSNAHMWEWLCAPDDEAIPTPFPHTPFNVRFRARALELIGLLPVVLLMAATRADNGFVISPELRDHLVRPATLSTSAPLAILKRKIGIAQTIQTEWTTAVNHWTFPQAARDRLRSGLNDRIAAWRIFADAIRPLRPEPGLANTAAFASAPNKS